MPLLLCSSRAGSTYWSLGCFLLLSLCGPVSAVCGEELSAAATAGIEVGADDWPWWRGPSRDGVASGNQSPPLKWGPESNIRWQVPLPGRGHGAATVVGRQVVIAIADAVTDVQAVICFDRDSGKQLWRTDVHQGGLATKGNKKASQASTTVACDGERYFVNFLNGGAVYTTALSRDGKRLWQTRITDYTIHQGYGASPTCYGPLVLVSADNKGGGAVAGLLRESGKVVWRRERPKKPNYTSPIVLRVDGRDQLIFTGCDLVTSLNPLNGKTLWEVEGATTECVTSVVTDGTRVFTSGGYPDNHVSALRGDGSGKTEWRNSTRVYVPSMLVRGSHLFAVADAGIAICYESDTGKVVWKQRLEGVYTSSPVLVGDRIYATSESGRTTVFRADPAGFERLAVNRLGDEVFATPTICGGRIYQRIARREDGRRREYLVCLEDRD